MRSSARPATLAAIGVLIMLAASAAAAERPELTGLWTNVSATTLTRPAGVEKLVLNDQEAANLAAGLPVYGIPRAVIESDDYTAVSEGAPQAGGADFGVRAYNAFWMDPGDSLAQVKGEYRSSYIVAPDNGQIPWREEVRQQRAAGSRYVTGIGGNEGPEVMPLGERCLIGFGNTGGPGMLSVMYNNNYQIVQTPTHVMILVEMVHDVRIIPLFRSAAEARASHRPAAITPWLGDSVGWYEDGALLVETINLHPLQVASSAIPIGTSGRIVERFERYSPSEIVYRFTVEDAGLYTRPWTAELSFHAAKGPIYEYACHEGNYAMGNILRGARLQEAKHKP